MVLQPVAVVELRITRTSFSQNPEFSRVTLWVPSIFVVAQSLIDQIAARIKSGTWMTVVLLAVLSSVESMGDPEERVCPLVWNELQEV